MADDKNERRPQDAQRINVNEDYEVRYWTKALNVTKEEELIAVVKQVGVMAEDVRQALRSNRKTA